MSRVFTGTPSQKYDSSPTGWSQSPVPLEFDLYCVTQSTIVNCIVGPSSMSSLHPVSYCWKQRHSYLTFQGLGDHLAEDKDESPFWARLNSLLHKLTTVPATQGSGRSYCHQHNCLLTLMALDTWHWNTAAEKSQDFMTVLTPHFAPKSSLRNLNGGT